MESFVKACLDYIQSEGLVCYIGSDGEMHIGTVPKSPVRLLRTLQDFQAQEYSNIILNDMIHFVSSHVGSKIATQ